MRTTVEFEKGVPVPPKQTLKNTLMAMEVGDSFLVPDDWSIVSLRTVAGFFPGMYSILRVEGRQHRCWRIK